MATKVNHTAMIKLLMHYGYNIESSSVCIMKGLSISLYIVIIRALLFSDGLHELPYQNILV